MTTPRDERDGGASTVAALRRKARGPLAELSPEDVLGLVHVPDREAAASALRELSGGWPRCPCFPKVPMGSWADAVVAWIEGGVGGIVAFSRGDPHVSGVACSTLAEVGREAAGPAQVNAALGGLLQLDALGADRVRFLAVLEEVLFAREVDVEPEVARRVREVLHARTSAAASEDELFLATDVLRYVGDATSIALLTSFAASSSPDVDEKKWTKWRAGIVADIRKRSRKRSG